MCNELWGAGVFVLFIRSYVHSVKTYIGKEKGVKACIFLNHVKEKVEKVKNSSCYGRRREESIWLKVLQVQGLCSWLC